MNNNSKDIFDKRLVAIVISIALVFVSLVGFTLLRPFDVAYAAAPMGSWTDKGNYDTSWYVRHENYTEYTLTTPKQLAGLAAIVNGGTTFSGKTIKLGADIYLLNTGYNSSGLLWTPIGSYGHYFAGTFDGQGYKIRNMNVKTNDDNSGLFGLVSGATIKNVILADKCSVTSTANNVGGIVGAAYNGTLIENVTNNGSVTGTGNDKYNVGGIAGLIADNVSIKNSFNYGNVIGVNNNIGGIVGGTGIDTIIENVSNNGSVSGNYNVGGIVGVNNVTLSIKDATNSGNITGTNNNVGGIIGTAAASVGTFNCRNSGTIKGSEIVGGIVGYVNEGVAVIHNSYNLGTVYASKGYLGSGGILGTVGHTNATATIVNCYNAGGITGNRYKGGIVGVNYGKLTISNAYYLDNITDALGINVGDQGATYSITATQMTDANMKGAVDVSSSLAYALNEYVSNNHTYTIGLTNYILRFWNVPNNAYPTFSIPTHWTERGIYDTSWYVGHESDTIYTLTTPEQFAGLAAIVNGGTTFSGKTIKLGGNIDLSGTVYKESGLLWAPIGSYGRYFAGTFDGQGHTISNMKVNTTVDNSGLFGLVSGATIKNVILADKCSVTSTANNVGGIVGMADTGTAIKNVTNNGTVSGTYDVGGIVGKALGNTTIDDAVNSGNITGTNNNVGGIIGTAAASVGTFNCRNSGTIKGSEIIGGIVGYVNDNTTVICNSYNVGTVYASNGALGSGGILGAVGPNNATANIVNCYNVGEITSNGYKGGIVGVNFGTLTIDSSYYLNNIADVLGINVGDQGATSSITATQMTDANMKGAVDVSSSLAYVLNEYVNKHSMYTFGTTDYVLKLWNVTNNNYPTLGDNYHLIGIAVTYNGGEIAKGEKIQSDKIEITATYSDGSTATISATDENVTYWIYGKQIENFADYRFNTMGTIAVTVKYSGQEAVTNITVVEPILTEIAATYNGGNIAKGNKIESDKIEITATYSDGSTATLSASDVTYSINEESIADFVNYRFNTMGTIAVTVKYGGQEAVTNITVVEPILMGITATYNGNIAKGNKIESDEIVITATYSDDSTSTVSETDENVTYWIEGSIADFVNYRFNTMGTIVVTVKYGGQEAEMSINIVNPIVTGITVTYPGGVIYRNHNIQSDNIGITATYSDDSTSTVSATDENVTYWIDGKQIENFADYIFNKVGIIAVTVKYNGQETVMNLIVAEPILTGIAATYTGGDIAKGNKMQGPYIQITAMYSDDSTRSVSSGDEDISYWLGKKILDKPAAYRFNTIGTIAVTVKYQGHEAVMNINVVDPILTGITVNYNGGVIFKDEKIQCDKIEIIATYSDDSTETVSTDNENVSYWVDKAEIEDFFNYVFDEERQYELTVKYQGREAEMNLTVIATYWTDTGNYDTSWYEGNESDTEYTLTTPAQLAGLAYLVNNDNNDIKMFNGKTIKLGDDIDLNGHRWMPIGNEYSYYYFAGTFDGQGHTISNMIVKTNADNSGLFGVVGIATIKNVILASSCSVTSTANNIGGIVGSVWFDTIIENVINNGTISGGNYVGGIVGIVNDVWLSIKDVTNNANISGTYCVGGILGCTGGAYGRVSIKNATNSGAISGENRVGGIAGECNGEIEDAINGGEVTGTDNSVGGIVGVIRSLANNDIDVLLINCNNTAGISGRNQIGGIVGCVNEGAVVICNSYNVGTLYTSQNCFGIGGILGAIEQHNAKVTISNCYNAGEIIGTDIIGGIVGLNFGTLVVDNVYYLDNIVDALGESVEDQGATYTGTATQMNESDMKGDSDNINSLIFKLGEYVNEHPTYMVGSTEYALKLWSLVAENVYPTLREYSLIELTAIN